MAAPADLLTDEQRGELREALLRLQTDLEAQRAASADDARPVDLDLSIGRLSRVDALQQQHLALARKERVEAQAQQIRAALARMDAGAYGECVSCGEPIGYGRLRARPEAPFCLACQR